MKCQHCNHQKATHDSIGVCLIEDCSCGNYEAEQPTTIHYTDYESQIRRTLANKTGNLLAEKNTELNELRAALAAQQQHTAELEEKIERLENDVISADNVTELTLKREEKLIAQCKEQQNKIEELSKALAAFVLP